MAPLRGIFERAMASNVWGTFAVNDHCRPNAFASEILLFDRLVIPVPEGAAEIERWRAPNKRSPEATWDPDRQERLLRILGTQKNKGDDGAELAFEIPWTEARWQLEKSREELAVWLTLDAFHTTRMVAAGDATLPKVIEAVAAFPSEAQWREELAPSVEPPPPTTAARALIRFARPHLAPPPERDSDQEFTNLRHAIELARDPEFQSKRDAYYAWVRAFVSKLQKGPMEEVLLDGPSVALMEEELTTLVAEERALVERRSKLRLWTPVEYTLMTVGAVAAGAAPFAAASLAIGLAVGGSALGLAGWAASKFGEFPEPRPLGGAAMFIAAERRFRH